MKKFLILSVFAFLLVEFSLAGTVEDPTQNNPPSSGGGSGNGSNCDYCGIPCGSDPNTGCGKTLVSLDN